MASWLDRVGAPAEPFITATITSPPYGGLKDYGQREQIGWAQSYGQYLADCRDVLAALFDLTKDDGSLWLVADSLRMPVDGGGPWRLEPLPFHLADEASKAGWLLRDVVIWRKDRSAPWSGRGRLRNVFEYVLQFVKSDEFKYHIDRIRNPSQLEEWWVRFPERYHPYGKVPPNVWDIPIPRQGAWKPTAAARHACPLPGGLVEHLVLLSTDAGDLVMDPFAGVGSVVAHAERLGRRGLGLETNPAYVDVYWKEVRPTFQSKITPIGDDERVSGAAELARKIMTLRVLKLPRVLFEAVRPSVAHDRLISPIVISVVARPSEFVDAPADGTKIRAELIVVAEGREQQLQELSRALVDAASRRPASKFGVVPSIRVVRPEQFADSIGRKRLHYYLGGRTWRCEGGTTPDQVLKIGSPDPPVARSAIPPIVSNLHIDERPRPIG